MQETTDFEGIGKGVLLAEQKTPIHFLPSSKGILRTPPFGPPLGVVGFVEPYDTQCSGRRIMGSCRYSDGTAISIFGCQCWIILEICDISMTCYSSTVWEEGCIIYRVDEGR